MADTFSLFSFDDATSVVYKAQLTSSDPTEAGISTGDLQSGAQTFSASGMDIQPLADETSVPMRVSPSAPNVTALDSFATIQFEIGSGIWVQDVSDTQGNYLWARYNDGSSGRDGHIAKLEQAIDGTAFRAGTGFYGADVNINETGKGVSARVYFEQDVAAGWNIFWVDDLPVNMDDQAYVTGSNTNLDIGGANGQGTGTGGINLKNYKIQSAIADRPVAGSSDTHGWLGDSFTNQGSQSQAIGNNRVPWVAGNGWTQGGGAQTGPDLAVGAWDSSIIPNFYRYMYKAGIWLGNETGFGSSAVAASLKNVNYAQSGSGMTVFPSGNTPLDWWNQLLTDTFDPNWMSNNFGTNDAVRGSAFDSTEKTLFETNYLALLRAQLDYGVSGVTLWTVPWLGNQTSTPDYTEAQYVTSTASVNDSIQTIYTTISGEYGSDKIALVDANATLGTTSANFQAGDIHPSNLGSNLLGEASATAMLSLIIPASTGSPTLTTPYSIGTNNGPLFVSTSSDTIATVEGAGFLNDRPGWASLLKTGDVVIIQASNATKMYTVTVDVQARIITLSTGLTIA